MAAIVVFTRYPEAGKVKTRLIPALGPAGAADLHRRMALHTLQVADRAGATVEVRHTGSDLESIRQCFGAKRAYAMQGEGDLGARMSRALTDQFRLGTDRAIIIGTDCPALTPALLRLALSCLHRRDLVLGPAADGGYYLIGLRTPRPELFTGIEWGTERVLAQTLQAARRLNLSVHLLPRLGDVDTPDDLATWRRHNERLSVIVPTCNEEARIAPTLERLLAAADVEVLVADGGSADATCRIAESMNVRVVVCPRGRARQMNAGASATNGGRLLFCHADTLLPPDYDVVVRQTLADPRVALGAFTFAIAGRQAAFRRIEFGANLRSCRFKLPYGDQSLFLRRSTFDRLRGFANLPVMEDFDLARRAGRLGTVVTVPQRALTSSRRWLTHGVLATTLKHQRLIAAYCMGFHHTPSLQ